MCKNNNSFSDPKISISTEDVQPSKTMGKLAKWIIRLWWLIPCLFFLQTWVLNKLIYKYPCSWKENLAWTIFYILIILDLVKYVYLLKYKKWIQVILSLCLSFVMFITLIFTSFVAMSAPTGFAKSHPIPKGVKCSIPLRNPMDNVPVAGIPPIEVKIDSTDRDSYLQIWNGHQGGIYLYDFYYPALPEGKIYLKCFEVGKNLPLSPNDVKKKSTVAHPTTTSFSKIIEQQEFTIYEGDWNEYYAVRVEVWHKEKESHKETKLLEKIYKMEGWMR